MVHMNDYGSRPQDSRCYEQLMPLDDMSYSGSLAHGFRCYEQLRVMEDMNESRSYEFRPLDHMNNSRL